MIHDATILRHVLLLANRTNPKNREEMDLSKVFKGSLVRVIAELRSLVPKGVSCITRVPFRGI